MDIWNEDEGVLDTRVLATHEAQSGQPAGTLMVEKEKSQQGTYSENVETGVTSPPPPFRHEKWKRARIKKSGAPSSEQSGVIIEKIVSYFCYFQFF